VGVVSEPQSRKDTKFTLTPDISSVPLRLGG
jgi:hypothetical protein